MYSVGTTEGHQIFVKTLTRFAEHTRSPQLMPFIWRIAEPVRVAVVGRDGVGRDTVARSLSAAGVAVTTDASVADVRVVVIAEALKPEDRALLDAADAPAITVLNKADLTGLGGRGPLALAHRRAAACRAITGVPTVPMVALLAVAELDDELIRALQTLVMHPANLSSTDAFVGTDHELAPEVRQRLLDTLDRFGIAHAVLAIGEGTQAAALTALMRRASLLDRVVEQLDATAAAVRYRRIRSVITELRALAIQSGDERLTEFLSTDETVLAVMAAAVDVVEAEGARVDTAADPAAHLRRAVYWRRYGRGPVNALHRGCADDIARGSLRLLGQV